MKKLFLLSICLCLLLAGCAVPPSPPQETEPPSTPPSQAELLIGEGDVTYTATGEKRFTFRFADPEYVIIQGGYFDGAHYYIAAIKKLPDGYETARIAVLDASGNRLRESTPLHLDHANSITYNDRLDCLVIAHCQSPDGHYYRYSLVDPVTLKIIETDDREYPFFSIAYSPEREQYASAQWGGETIDIWDKDLFHLQSYPVEKPGSLSQGVFCDENGIYFVRSSQNGFPAELRVYDWNANLLRTVTVDLPGDVEPESISLVDGDIYVVGTDWSRGCGVAYRLLLTKAEAPA